MHLTLVNDRGRALPVYQSINSVIFKILTKNNFKKLTIKIMITIIINGSILNIIIIIIMDVECASKEEGAEGWGEMKAGDPLW